MTKFDFCGKIDKRKRLVIEKLDLGVKFILTILLYNPIQTMKKSFCYIFAILWSLSLASAVQAQDFAAEYEEDVAGVNDVKAPDASRPKLFSAVKCLGKSKNGYAVKRYLMIDYPWSVIQNATLEVRIIGPEAEKQPQFCNPVYFMSIFGKLEQIDKDIFNKKLRNPRFTNNIEYAQAIFHEYGLPEPESLTLATIKPVSGARADFFHIRLVNPDTKELETTLIFHDLPQWAVDKGRLALELQGKSITDAEGKNIKEIEFEKPCKIKIWLLHDDYIVWEETFQWPGTEADKPKKSAGKKAVEKFNDDDEDPRQAAKKMENKENKQDKNEQEEAQEDDLEDNPFEDGGADGGDNGGEMNFDGFGDDF